MNTLNLRTLFFALAALCFGTIGYSQAYPDQPLGMGPTVGVATDNPQSNPAAVTDGTPASTTTIVATDVANANAFVTPDAMLSEFPGETPATTAQAPAEQTPPSTTGVDGGVGSYKIDGVKADLWTLTVPYSVKVSDRSTVVTTLPFTITNFKSIRLANGQIGDASVYGEGFNAGWSYKVYDKQDNVPYRWNVTPTGGIYLRRSSDLHLGSWVYNAGFSSSFAYQFSGGWVANLGNSITMAWNNGYKNYPDPVRDEQEVVINGVQVFKPIDRWMVGGMVIDTRYLRKNLVNSFQTYAITAGYRVTPTRSLRVSLVADTGKGYHSIRGTLGSSWKF